MSLFACTGTQTTTQGLVMLDGKTYLVRFESRREMSESVGSSFAVSVDGGAGQWLPVGSAYGSGSLSGSSIDFQLSLAGGNSPNEELKRVYDLWYSGDAKARKNVQTESRQYYLGGFGYPGADPTHRTLRADGAGGGSNSSND